MFTYTCMKGSYIATQTIIKHIQSIFIEVKPFLLRFLACHTKLLRLHALVMTICR